MWVINIIIKNTCIAWYRNNRKLRQSWKHQYCKKKKTFQTSFDSLSVVVSSKWWRNELLHSKGKDWSIIVQSQTRMNFFVILTFGPPFPSNTKQKFISSSFCTGNGNWHVVKTSLQYWCFQHYLSFLKVLFVYKI